MSATIANVPLSDIEHSAQLRKAVIAATVGTTIEWYDFFIYGTAAGLIFPHLFFPNQDPLTGTLASFSTYFVGFAGRPIGAAIFGHYGDRIGRKATLISTLLVMGIATFLIAFVPGYDQIGIWGAVILTPVSYTHLDVYKRQVLNDARVPVSGSWLGKNKCGNISPAAVP